MMMLTALFLVMFVLDIVRVLEILFLELVFLIVGRPLVSSTHVWGFFFFAKWVLSLCLFLCNCT